MAEKKKYTYDYPHPAVTTDCVIFGYDVKEGLSVLLVERGLDPYKGRWAFPGGFMRIDEDAETGARRELKEETGLETAYIEQFGCFTDVKRDPRERVITIAYFALVRKSDVKGGDDAAAARWFPISEVPALAFDHDRILRVALGKLKEKIHFEPVGFELLPEVFTMPQLQDLYQAILDVTFDRRNFASKMLKLGILDEVGERPKNAGPRIPVKYSFNKENYETMKSKGFRLEF
jgi:ADP-ribose pyrophosphatase